jgi:hypothetical protein
MGRFADAKTSIDSGDFAEFLNALAYYDRMLEEGQEYLDRTSGTQRITNPVLLVELAGRNPGMQSQYFQLAQEADGLKEYILDHANAAKVRHLKRYKEAYNRDLSDRVAEKYAEGERDYLMLRELAGEAKLRAEKIVGFTKGLEQLHYQIGHNIKMRELGIEDATF